MRRLTAMLRRRAPLLAFGLVSVLAAVVAFTLVWPRTYQSSALIVVEQRTGTGDPTLALLSQLGRASVIETEIELLKSRHVVERAVDDLDLHATVEPLRASTRASTSLLDRVGEAARSALRRSPDGARPGAIFSAFDAGRDARPGLYRVSPRALGGFEVSDVRAETLLVWVAPDSAVPVDPGEALPVGPEDRGVRRRFAGITLTVPNLAEPWQPFHLRVEPFAEAVASADDRVSAGRKQRDADLIDVDCKGPTPERARELCQGIVDSYMELRTTLRRAEATATAEFLRGEVADLGQQLSAAEGRLQSYGARTGAVALSERAAEEVRQLTQLTAQREQLNAERQALSGLIDQIERGEQGTRRYRNLASFPTFLQNAAVTQLLAEIAVLENERSTLRLRRAETSTEVVAIDRRIVDIEMQLLSTASSYHTALGEQIRALDAALRSSGRRIAAIPRQQVESARLERDVTVLGGLYAQLQANLAEAEVAESVNLPNVRVVDRASLPLDPSHPKLRLNLVLGTVLGLAFGFVLALYKEATDGSIHDRGDVEQEFRMPVLAVVPRLKRSVSILPLPTLRRPAEGEQLDEPGENGRPETTEPVVHRRATPVSSGPVPAYRRIALESFRALAMDLRFATRHLGRSPAIVVTSAVSGEGKTFVACNLALARAAQGVRTLLIDADMRGGGATSFFRLPRSQPGLSNIVVGGGTLSAVECVWKARVGSGELWVIPPGTPRLYSEPFFEFPKYATLLEQAKLQFDLIVIDTPPINLITDTAAIAAASDGVLLVVRGSMTTREYLDLAVERLGRAGSSVIGAVLNEVAAARYYASLHEYADAAETT